MLALSVSLRTCDCYDFESTVQKQQKTEAKDSHLDIWATFCLQHYIDPFLSGWEGPIPFLAVFAQCCRVGRLAVSIKPVRSKQVKKVLCLAG